MKRRVFIATATCSLLSPWTTAGQQRLPRLAVVPPSDPVTALTAKGPIDYWRAFFTELEQLGFQEDRDLQVDRYSGEGRTDQYGALAKYVVSRNPDVIFTMAPRMIEAFRRETGAIPIVASTSDPIAFGVSSSLATPERNITGVVSDAGIEVNDKRLSLLKELIPVASRFGFLAPTAVMELAVGRRIQEVTQRMGVTLVKGPLESPIHEAEYSRVFSLLQDERVDGLVVASNPENLTHSRAIVELANRAKLPTIYPFGAYVEVGGLIAYTVDLPDLFRHAAGQIAKILKGAKVGEVPFYQATTLKLLINLKTAKTLGITIPPSLLARADEVIE